MMKGHDAQVLRAMGLNPALAGRPFKPGEDPFAKRIKPPAIAQVNAATSELKTRTKRRLAEATVAANRARIASVQDPELKTYLQGQLKLFQWQNGLVKGTKPTVPPPPSTPASVAALNAYNERVRAAKVAKTQAEAALTRAQGSRSAAAGRLSQAQTQYADYIRQVNQTNERAVQQYNLALRSGLQDVATQYNRAVADTNIQIAQQSTGPTQLLSFDIKSAYKQAAQRFTPLPTTPPPAPAPAPAAASTRQTGTGTS
jgi:hypothetical protein